MNFEYTVYYPGGNPTALIEGSYPADVKKRINDHLLALDPKIEQVGFIQRNEDGIFLDMAGGEFCGNAARSAFYHYLEDKESSSITVSGAPGTFAGGISGNCAWSEMPVIQGSAENSIKKIDDAYILVEMHGVSHLLVYDTVFLAFLDHDHASGDDHAHASIDDHAKAKLKEHARSLCHLHKIHNPHAVGVMFIEKRASGFYLYPVVFVWSVNTCFFETACGSGTTALGLHQSFLEGKSKKTVVHQPSGECIDIDVRYTDGIFSSATISGKVSRLYADTTTLL